MTSIDELRIYCEVYEQGLDFKKYIDKILEELRIKPNLNICYISKNSKTNSIFSKLTSAKNYDLLISAISGDIESIILAVEYSAAVPTDDHIMQRADGQYWCAKYHVPYMKISPRSKGMGTKKNHGGGNKITDDFEKFVALKAGIPYYKIEWKSTEHDPDLLEINDTNLSCIPYNDELYNILHNLLSSFTESDPSEYFENILANCSRTYSSMENTYTLDKIKKIYTESTRITWNNDSITVKINRFGHAMDPERGMVYFMSMLLGREHVTSEIQMQRKGMNIRGSSYNALYDGISNSDEYLSEMSQVLAKGNIISPSNAFSLFLRATNLEQYFKNIDWIDANTVNLDAKELQDYLDKNIAITPKFIFLLSSKLILTDLERHVLVTINYDAKIVAQHLQNLDSNNRNTTQIQAIGKKDINEDLITYASVSLFKQSNIALLAVSYPGAQGDRCILIPTKNSNGKSTPRKYVDIIGYRTENSTVKLYLQENKALLKNSRNDCKKLHELKDKQRQNINKFVSKVGCDTEPDSIIIGLGAKQPKKMLAYDVSYIMTFDYTNISSNEILWQIWICDTNLINDFKDIKGNNGKLKGTMKLPTPLNRISNPSS